MKNYKILDRILNALCTGLKKELKLSTEKYERIFVERYKLLWYCSTPEVNRKTLIYQELSLSLASAKLQLDLNKSVYWFFRRLKNYYNLYDFLRFVGFVKYESFKCLLKIRKLDNNLKTFDGINIMYSPDSTTRKDAERFFIKETLKD